MYLLLSSYDFSLNLKINILKHHRLGFIARNTCAKKYNRLNLQQRIFCADTKKSIRLQQYEIPRIKKNIFFLNIIYTVFNICKY